MSLGGLNFDDEDSDMDFFNDIEIEHKVIEEHAIKDETDFRMCCCKKDENHDETMKFVCKGQDNPIWKKPLFPSK